MLARKQILMRVEGKALLRDKSGRYPLLVSMRGDRQFWIEIRSPLGGPFAVLRADEDWVEFYIPRRKEIYRIPAAEFWRPSQRQRNFLQLLPVKIMPERMMDLILGRLDPAAIQECQWLANKNVYAVNLKSDNRTYYFQIDPLAYFPTQSGKESDEAYMKQVPGQVYQTETLEFASSFEFYQKDQKELQFEWIELTWKAELGEKPPFFPESLSVKRINY
jgi:hypothetical protein